MKMWHNIYLLCVKGNEIKIWLKKKIQKIPAMLNKQKRQQKYTSSMLSVRLLTPFFVFILRVVLAVFGGDSYTTDLGSSSTCLICENVA